MSVDCSDSFIGLNLMPRCSAFHYKTTSFNDGENLLQCSRLDVRFEALSSVDDFSKPAILYHYPIVGQI